MSKYKLLTDKVEIKDQFKSLASKGGPKKTKIIFSDANTGEILGEYENKVVITGSMATAGSLFGIDYPFIPPTYNSELELQNSEDPGTTPTNPNLICLFCVGDSGCGTDKRNVFTARYIDRIAPTNDIMPFRLVPASEDIDVLLRTKYFGRKELTLPATETKPVRNMIAYYFKAFESTPQMFTKYTDTTEITDELYNVETTQDADCYVETDLLIGSEDLREYFDEVIGWDHARISTLSLCTAWYTESGGYKWYQDIMPYTKLNFSADDIIDATKTINIKYMIFF